MRQSIKKKSYFYSEHIIYECFKTCLGDIFMHNNATFKFIIVDQQLQPYTAKIFFPPLFPPASAFKFHNAPS